MLKRKIYQTLLNWKKESKRKALCIIGARQIGKTTIVREFAKNEYKCLIELNFLLDPKACEIFSSSLDPRTLLMNITAYTQQELIPDETLILFGEIQECPEARTAIKFLVEYGKYDYIETGSMLGVKINAVRSYPVGFEQIISMYPLDFEEFCWANGIQPEIIDYLRSCYTQSKEVSSSIHDTMTTLFQRYIAVGGMPEAVNQFIHSPDMAAVFRVQKELIQLFQNDIRKYADPSKRAAILEIFNAIPSQLNTPNKRFMSSKIFPTKKMARLEQEFSWITLAGLGLPSYNLEEPQEPLLLNEKRNLFRFFLFDTGLLCAMNTGNVHYEILQGRTNINEGSLLENCFATQLVANGFQLTYYNSKKIGEIDFVIQKESNPTLIEIKSGSNYTSHKALDNALAVKNWTFDQAIVFCKGNVKKEQTVTCYPWYMIMFLKPMTYESLILDDLHLEDLQVPNE